MSAETDPLAAGFDAEDVERARRYHRPLRVVLLAHLLVPAAVLAVLAWTALGDRLYDATGSAFWLAVASSGLVALLLLPLSFWRGFLYERRWRLATLSARRWTLDWLAGTVFSAAVAGGVAAAVAASARSFPRWWPLVLAGGAVAVQLVAVVVAPLVFERFYFRLRPLADAELAARLSRLADTAGAPVRTVLVANASRRTARQNAYVSGLGPTRRLVVFDTLLADAPQPEVEVVVAHELAHRRRHHVLLLTLAGASVFVLAVLVVWAVLGSRAADGREAPLVLLLLLVTRLATLPAQNALSRRFERTADAGALAASGDLAAYESLYRRLARRNLAELSPPRLLHLAFATHPAPPERILRGRAGA